MNGRHDHIHDHDAHEHEHEHEHQHSETCSCGHDHKAYIHGHEHHEHIHEHDEGTCSCGHDHAHEDHGEHNHNHAHNHDNGDGCGEVHVERHMHDEACVISGSLQLFTEYEKLRAALTAQLETLAKSVQEYGGIVGHIKASCEALSVEMFSVTDTDVSVKKAPGQEIKINTAAIVFLIEPEKAEVLVTEALNAVKAAVSSS